MKLSRQIFLTVSLLFLLMFVGTAGISLNNTRNYLFSQLESHAQDTASSLGLSLSPYMSDRDLVMIGSMVDAIFDNGYYRFIRLHDNHGGLIHGRELSVTIDGVPSWFIAQVPLETPTAEAVVMAGWNRAGTLSIASHPGYAYAVLWRITKETLLWFAACAALGMGLAYLVLREIFKPLRAVEEQAEAICNLEYPTQAKLPWAPELRRMVEAMNRLSAKVEATFNEQAVLAKRLQQDAYGDPVTGLGNRRYFEAQMAHLLVAGEEFSVGPLLLIEMSDFKAYNDHHGFLAGDELLFQVANILKQTCGGQVSLAARLTGADFALLLKISTRQEAESVARDLLSALVGLRASGPVDQEDIAHIGIFMCQSGDTVANCLAGADLALQGAKLLGPNKYHALVADHLPVNILAGAHHWREELLRYLREERILLHLQPVVARGPESSILLYSVLLRARDDEGELIPAGVLMPMAERVGLSQALDRRAIELAAHLLADTLTSVVPLAINLAPSSVIDTPFLDWLEHFLRHSSYTKRMIFEVREDSILSNHETAARLVDLLAPFGCGFGINHFGHGFSTFPYLLLLKIRYLKINGAYIHGIDRDKGNQMFVRALVLTAHHLDINVIAVGVETTNELSVLNQMSVDGFQGYLMGAPGEGYSFDNPSERGSS